MADELSIVLRQPHIEPPQGWEDRTPEGVLKTEALAGDEGRLARLDAVVSFVMERDGLPCSEAVAVVCDALDAKGDALPLYLLRQSGFAVALPANACFGGRDLYGLDVRAGTCGRRGAIGAMRRCWALHAEPVCSVYEAANLDCLAVPLRHACELWGYGRAVGAELALPSPGAFTPAPSWCLEDARGHMAFEGPGDIDDRRVVLLRDVVQWIVKARRCPLRVAVKDVISDLAAAWASSWLYMAVPGDYARPMREDDCFSGARSFWGQFAQDDTAASCGLLGLLYAMREHWGTDGLPDADQVKRKGLQALESAAVRMDVAHALWGWGTVAVPATAADASPNALADWPALVAYRKANPGSDWGMGNQLDILRSELERRMDGRKETKSAALDAMAKELGQGSRQSLSKVLSTERKRAKQVASAATPRRCAMARR